MSDYLECATCHHPAEWHKLDPRDADLPPVLASAPCGDCSCDDYDGLDHPERPSLANAVIWRNDAGGIEIL